VSVSIESGCIVASGTRVNKVKLLKQVIKDTFWMARRYAHGRRTYAPGMVREAYTVLKKHFPDCVPQHDVTISTTDGVVDDWTTIGDTLYDCND
jgi:hypothetical protein